MSSPFYDIVIVVHVAAALSGFGAAALTGWYAAAVRQHDGGVPDERVLRYFRPGVNWAGRALLLVPLLGAALLALGHGKDLGQPYPWVGLALWTAATGLATGVIWPGERRIQQALAAPLPALAVSSVPGGSTDLAQLSALCRRVERAAGAMSVLFVLAVAVMVIQPG